MTREQRALLYGAVLGFGAGVGFAVDRYDRQEQQKQEQRAEQVRKCMGYLVVTSDGKSFECKTELTVRPPYMDRIMNPSKEELARFLKRTMKGNS